MAIEILHTSEPGYQVLRSNEGKALKAYKDVVGVWTIGYGQTNADAAALGLKVGPGVTITEAQAEDLLRRSVTTRYESAVRVAMPGARQQDFDAGVDFHYNSGAIKRASWVKSFAAKNLPAVHSQLLSWNKAGGRELAALTRRRNREWAMINVGDYGPEGKHFKASQGFPAAGAAPATPVVPTPVPAPGEQSAGAAPAAGGVQHPGMLMLGDSGPEVADLQHVLIAVGYKDVGTEGVYGPKTVQAVSDFQKRHPQLRVDGRVGPATRSALQRDLDAKAKLAGTIKKGGGGSATTVAIDQATGGHLPWWVFLAIGIAVVGGLAWTAWKYRDEIRGMLFKSEKNT
jgi:lysozyme